VERETGFDGPSTKHSVQSSPIVWVSRRGAARMAAQDVSRLSDRGSERSRGHFGPARTCRCRGFVTFYRLYGSACLSSCL